MDSSSTLLPARRIHEHRRGGSGQRTLLSTSSKFLSPRVWVSTLLQWLKSSLNVQPALPRRPPMEKRASIFLFLSSSPCPSFFLLGPWWLSYCCCCCSYCCLVRGVAESLNEVFFLKKKLVTIILKTFFFLLSLSLVLFFSLALSFAKTFFSSFVLSIITVSYTHLTLPTIYSV